MKRIITILLMSLFCITSYSQLNIDSVYYYNQDGTKNWWYVQKDVYCFHFGDSDPYTNPISPNLADDISLWDNTDTKFNEICFNNNSSIQQRTVTVNQIQNENDFKLSSVAITKEVNADYSEQKYLRTDDKILITFKDPQLAESIINEFMALYDLELIFEPFDGLPTTVSWTYIFKLIQIKGEDRTSIDVAKEIFVNSSDIVKISEPNIIGTTFLACDEISEFTDIPSNGTNGTWHLKNDGGLIWNNGSGLVSGINDADADICECWGDGYNGTGIKVGLIDQGGFEFGHPDLDITQLYDCRPDPANAGQPYGVFMTNRYDNPNIGHGMQVAGVIGANVNNTTNGQRFAAGAAYGSDVYPYLIGAFDANTTLVSNDQVVIGLQRLIIDGIDVVNLSFKTDGTIGTITQQIDNITTVGRPSVNAPNGQGYGIVVVASAGNADGEYSHFPANLPNVLAVGWSNPEDYRSSVNAQGTNDGWTVSSGEGSSFGPPSFNYDVVAPGELIMTTDIQTTQSSYIPQKGSSFSSPIVASIVAIILQKNPDLTTTQIRTIIRNGADKVHPSTYNYNEYPTKPGYSKEMFYGRVSCIQSLNDPSVGLSEEIELINLVAIRQNINEYQLLLPEHIEKLNLFVFDLTGRLVQTSPISETERSITINLSSVADGMYIVKLMDSHQQIGSVKLIK